MTPIPCRCEELEVVVERIASGLWRIHTKENHGGPIDECKFSECKLYPFLSGPAPTSLLARREAEQKVIHVAREYHAECTQALNHLKNPRRSGPCVLCDSISELDAQLDKEKA